MFRSALCILAVACVVFVVSTALPTLRPHPSSEIIIGDIRVQALSPNLLRVEPKGPLGFEDRTTFMVTSRDFIGIPISKSQVTTNSIQLQTQYYKILLKNATQLASVDPKTFSDVTYPVRSPMYLDGANTSTWQACSVLCNQDPNCIAWAYNVSLRTCFPLSTFVSIVPNPKGFTFYPDILSNCTVGLVKHRGPAFEVRSLDGMVLYDTDADGNVFQNKLHWPAPLTTKSYALTDKPRFFVPPWGSVPIPQDAIVDAPLRQTNGYDFRNNVEGDTYVFLLGSDLPAWNAARLEFLHLVGSCPLLPDFAYGTWFTYWHSYTESEAKDDIKHWEDLELPIDVWGLDMNWRNTTNNADRFYDHPNTSAFPNFTNFFRFLEEHKLRTYFNDHPFPVQDRGAGGGQTSPEEVAFRWNGLSEWMSRGLTFWWFDINWPFSIPPPFVDNVRYKWLGGVWQGLDTVAWGSHIYYSAVNYYDKTVRDKKGEKFYGGRPITLTKFSVPNWRAGMDPIGHAESPAQHRFPVWWTGDNVNLQGSVESMVDAGLSGFKPFVHSDCGGDDRGTAGDLLRWTAHCVFSPILRFHGSDHRAWTYNKSTVDTIRSYLNIRYKLIPSLIAAGHRATESGFPLAARGDFYWPEHKESASNHQYLFLEDILVAPVFNSSSSLTSRTVWIPPGDWEDMWDGSLVTGPETITITQPFERQPMWYRADGGLLVLAHEPSTRVEDQDWSLLTLEVFPSMSARRTRRTIFERDTEGRTDIALWTDATGTVFIEISAAEGAPAREWMLRVHLRKHQRAFAASINGESVSVHGIDLQPVLSTGFFPLAGAGTPPAPQAGPISELRIPRSGHKRVVIMLTLSVERLEMANTYI